MIFKDHQVFRGPQMINNREVKTSLRRVGIITLPSMYLAKYLVNPEKDSGNGRGSFSFKTVTAQSRLAILHEKTKCSRDSSPHLQSPTQEASCIPVFLNLSKVGRLLWRARQAQREEKGYNDYCQINSCHSTSRFYNVNSGGFMLLD